LLNGSTVRRTTKFVSLLALLFVAAFDISSQAQLLQPSWWPKLDPILQSRVSKLTGRSRVIVRASSPAALPGVTSLIQLVSGTGIRALPIITADAAEVPNTALATLAASALVAHLSVDRLIVGSLERTGATIGSTAARADYGLDGSGLTIATIDSGVTPWHDDLADSAAATQRVDRFVDFVNSQTAPYDDYGHGTHVAGIIAGDGFDSNGRRSGIAPGAHLVALKVLDANGRGRISDVVSALDYVVSHKDELNIRIVNLSVAAPVYESYLVDPLTLAARHAVDAGIVVVAAAGNGGRAQDGHTAYGGIAAPGNAPWVLTVGASSHMGTIDRADDTIAAFSARGPTAVDASAKPDVVAPGVGIESLTDPQSTLYANMSPYLLAGTIATSYLPYLSLTGTSMATPVVSGTVALMLQANPSLTPNAIKAILQYTSQVYGPYDRLTQGAGFLNARGAIDAARAFAAGGSAARADGWSGQIIWGNQLYAGAQLSALANEFAVTSTWGQAPWLEPDWTGGGNVVWGSTCGGASCGLAWTVTLGGGAIFATSDDETVVWGTSDDDSTVVWGTSCSDPSCAPVVWNP
jgi:serine protease AprX